MPRLKNIPIREKLQLFAIVLLFALSSVGLVGYQGIQRIGSKVEKHQQYFAAAQGMLQIDMVHHELRAIASRAVLLDSRRGRVCRSVYMVPLYRTTRCIAWCST